MLSRRKGAVERRGGEGVGEKKTTRILQSALRKKKKEEETPQKRPAVQRQWKKKRPFCVLLKARGNKKPTRQPQKTESQCTVQALQNSKDKYNQVQLTGKKKMREKAGKRKRDNTYTIEIKRAPLPKKKKKERQ